MTTITKEQFQAYETVRLGGITNMWDTKVVSQLSKRVLSPDDVLEVLQNYYPLCRKYPEIRQLTSADGHVDYASGLVKYDFDIPRKGN